MPHVPRTTAAEILNAAGELPRALAACGSHRAAIAWSQRCVHELVDLLRPSRWSANI